MRFGPGLTAIIKTAWVGNFRRALDVELGMRLTIALVLFATLALLVWAARFRSLAVSDEPTTQPTTQESSMKTETATFAAGCFWGVQATFEKLPGVISTRCGYSGGHVANPSYEQVCTETTGHAESVEVVFDPTRISYKQLVDVFFDNHDPTTPDRQGPDYGAQYRSVIFYHSPEQKEIALADKKQRDESGEYVGPISTQIVPAGPFYPAEEYHQFYFDKHGMTWSCHFGNGKKQAATR